MYKDELIQLGVQSGGHSSFNQVKREVISPHSWVDGAQKGLRGLYEDIGPAIHLSDSDDTKALCSAQAAKLIRDCMFDEDEQFQGNFTNDCKKSLSQLL